MCSINNNREFSWLPASRSLDIAVVDRLLALFFFCHFRFQKHLELAEQVCWMEQYLQTTNSASAALMGFK